MLAMRTYSAMVYAHSLVSSLQRATERSPAVELYPHYVLIDPGLVSIDSGR